MHRRASLRYPAVFKVVLYQGNRPIMECNAKNVCRDGLLVEAKNLTFQTDDRLDIEFEAAGGKSRQRARLPASVVHQSEHGLGLRFLEPTTREEILAHALLGYANRRFRVYHNPANPGNQTNLPVEPDDWQIAGEKNGVSTRAAH